MLLIIVLVLGLGLVLVFFLVLVLARTLVLILDLVVVLITPLALFVFAAVVIFDFAVAIDVTIGVRLKYRGLGDITVFLLFGPMLMQVSSINMNVPALNQPGNGFEKAMPARKISTKNWKARNLASPTISTAAENIKIKKETPRQWGDCDKKKMKKKSI